MPSLVQADHLLPCVSFRVVCNVRDCAVADVPLLDSPHVARTAILFDHDRDSRILAVLTSLHFRNPHVCAELRAIGETQGKITAWFDSAARENSQQLQQTVFAAAAIALRASGDSWDVNPPNFVQCPNRIVSRGALPADSPLRAIPSRFSIGVVSL